MPLYEYRCSHCGTVFERLRPSRQADDPAPCPCCGRGEGRRLLSLFAARSGGRSLTGPACGGCAGGSCSTCR